MSWQVMRLGDVLQLQYGKPLPEDQRDSSGRHAVYGANGEKARSDRYLHDKPSIVVGRKGSAGEIKLTEEKFWPLDVTYFTTFDESRYDLKFLYYLLDTLDLPSMARGVKPGINRNDVYALSVNIPGLPEQRRIAALLDEAFAGIATAKAAAEKNLRNAGEVFDVQREHLLVGENHAGHQTSLGDEIELLVGYAFKSSGYVESGNAVRLLRGDNVMQGYIRWDNAKHWPADDLAEYVRFKLQESDIVLAMDRPWIKAGLKRAMLGSEDLPALLVQRTACLRAGTRMDRNYLLHLVGSDAFMRHLLDVQTGIGVPHISGQQIKDFRFLRPSLEAQRRIVAKLDTLRTEISQLHSTYTRKLAALEELKQSLLHQAFSGQL